jgi:hypothetical protein
LPASSRADLARLRALAASHIEPTPDDESPSVGRDEPGLVQINPSLELSAQNAAWFARHGGSAALNRALNAYRSGLRRSQRDVGGAGRAQRHSVVDRP